MNPVIRTAGGVVYTLTFKKVKNINMRVTADLSVHVSANKFVSPLVTDRIVASKAAWIAEAKARIMHKAANMAQSDDAELSDKECMNLFEPIIDRFYPLFSEVCKTKPQVKVKLMKSRWGVCFISKNTIVLNKRLTHFPIEAIEYVVLHEYAHFIYPNHQKDFHTLMTRLMPDYRHRRKLLSKSE